MTELRAWLAGRTPAPPDALPLVLPDDPPGERDLGVQLTDAAEAALERALAGRGERGGAYDLLAADALVTYACEHAAHAPQPERALLRILDRIGRRTG